MKKIMPKQNENSTFIDFINDTKSGKYSLDTPIVVDYTYQRLNIQEQNEVTEVEEYNDNSFLYGISF